MRGIHWFMILGVVGVGGVAAVAMVAWSRPPVAQTDVPNDLLPDEILPAGVTNSDYAPVVLIDVPTNIRELERSRRPQRPADPKRKSVGLPYDSIIKGWNDDGKYPRPKPAIPMPPTACHSVEPAPKYTNYFAGPHRVHHQAVSAFEDSSGFGFRRMINFTNARGISYGSRVIDRVELVSLLTDYDVSVYVLDEMATPALARQAKRRPLDEFERLGLDAVRRGEHLVWTRESPTRMFGAIRTRSECRECHTNAKEGDLLGAFTYWLEKPVDRLGGKRDLD